MTTLSGRLMAFKRGGNVRHLKRAGRRFVVIPERINCEVMVYPWPAIFFLRFLEIVGRALESGNSESRMPSR